VSQDLQQARYDQLMRRVGGLIGPGSKVSEVLGELFPVLDVESVPGELLALMGIRLAAGSTSQGGAAAVQQRSQLFNPADSNRLITCTRIDVRSDATQRIHYGLVTDALGTATGVDRFRDGRFGTTRRPSGQTRFAAAAVISPSVAQLHVVGNVGSVLRDDNGLFVLSPGIGVQLTTSTLNTGLSASFLWRERAAERSELNF